jgi:hypothetical protein
MIFCDKIIKEVKKTLPAEYWEETGMKKYLNIAFAYAAAAMAGGVFYREFTKWNGYTGVTALGKVHAHLFLLGMMMFLLTALFADRLDLEKQKTFRTFLRLYNIGLPLTAVMLLVRGITEVRGTVLSSGANAAISGIAGTGHILVGAGLILLLLSIKKAESSRQTEA